MFCTTLLLSCRYDTISDNLPKVTYAIDITPKIKSGRAQSSCQSGVGKEFSLESYESVLSQVKPGDARGSKLYRVMTNRSSIVMPPPQAIMSDKQVTKIYLWIESGAKND